MTNQKRNYYRDDMEQMSPTSIRNALCAPARSTNAPPDAPALRLRTLQIGIRDFARWMCGEEFLSDLIFSRGLFFRGC
ncbi:hypothetical protein TNCT_386591 [Trichonephila clavata]|uniref:Uncharacterized protein n=1 Tax=Trichonephila clavata TaxID=2740835 RepID=A0A8X6LNL9_TRICU|nr:hypothetical protein TNCT_386591 [Trichonephila clavata]